MTAVLPRSTQLRIPTPRPPSEPMTRSTPAVAYQRVLHQTVRREFRMVMLPKMEELPGFAACTMLVDRDAGKTSLAVTYDSADAMRQAGERAAQLRAESPTTMGMRIDEMAEFDLVIAHLRVPETV